MMTSLAIPKDYGGCEDLVIVCGHAHFRTDLPDRELVLLKWFS